MFSNLLHNGGLPIYGISWCIAGIVLEERETKEAVSEFLLQKSLAATQKERPNTGDEASGLWTYYSTMI